MMVKILKIDNNGKMDQARVEL